MKIRSGALAFLTVLLLAPPAWAEVGWLSLEPLPEIVEIGAVDGMLTATPPAREEGAGIPAAESAAAPAVDDVDAALAPERFVDLDETDTMSLIAASLADAGDAAATGSIAAARAQEPAASEAEGVCLAGEVSPADAAETPIVP